MKGESMRLVPRRRILTSVAAIGASGLLARLARSDDPDPNEPFQPSFGIPVGQEPGIVPPAAVIGSITEDKLVGMARFGENTDQFILDTQGQSANTLCCTAIIEIPATVPQTRNQFAKYLTGYLVAIDGDLRKDGDSRILLSLDLCGTVESIDLKYGEPAHVKLDEYEFFSLPKFGTVVEYTDTDPPMRTTRFAPAPPFFTAVITITIQRRTADASASAVLRSLAVSMVQPKPSVSE
jgi:hypothetical protein